MDFAMMNELCPSKREYSNRNEARVAIGSAADIITARQTGRAMAMELGFGGPDVTVIASAICEVARNIVLYAKQGEIEFGQTSKGRRHGLQVVARDEGPGIRNVKKVMEYGYTSRKGMGAGLPEARWLMDEFEINSRVANGTTVTMTKWL